MADRKGWKYGKPTPELALDAVRALGGRATTAAVKKFIVEHVPDFNTKNVDADLRFLSVNSPSRANYGPNKRPRRTDQGSKYDALYIDRLADTTEYVLYDKEQHGVWELAAVEGDNKLRPRLVKEGQLVEEIAKESERANRNNEFDPTNETDARHKTIATIVQRRGQQKFRAELLQAYDFRCAITNCDFGDVLEAAHIRGYLGDHTNVVTNGLLLRADIHTLFDLGLIRIDPETLQVVLAGRLMDSEYRLLSGMKIRLPANEASWPNREALRMQGEESSAY